MFKKAFSIFSVLAFLANQGFAQTYTVTTTAGDSSAGSLGTAMSSASGDGANANDIIDFSALFNTPQTVTLTAPYASVTKNPGSSLTFGTPGSLLTLDGGGNTIFNLAGGGAFNLGNMILQNGSVAVSGGSSINVGSGQGVLVNTAVTGTGGFIASGSGWLALTNGANSYTGGTTISNGTLQFSSDGSLGAASGGVTLNGGTLQAGAYNIASSRSITLSGGGTFDADAEATTLSGVIGGTGGLNVISSAPTYKGQVTLTGNNTYTGGTTIGNLAVVAVSADNNLGDPSGGLTFNGGSLWITANMTTNRSVTLNAAGGTLNLGSQNATFSGLISGAGGLTLESFAGPSLETLTLSNSNNSYAGGTTISGFDTVVAISADGDLGAAGAGLTFDSVGRLQTTAGINTSRPITLTGGGMIDVDGQSDTFSGVISGAGNLGVYSANGGMLTLTSNNTYTGGTGVAGNATLSISSDQNLGAAAGSIIFDGGTLQTTAGISDNRTVFMDLTGTIDTDGQNDTFSGLITGIQGLTVNSSSGNGLLTLSGANAYLGNTTINSNATLSISNDDNLGAASSGLIFNGGTLRTTSGVSSNRTVTLSGNGTIDTFGQNDTLSGVIGGAGGLNVISSAGNGVLTLSGANTYSGGTTVGDGVHGMTLQLGAANGAGSGFLTVNGLATFNMNGFNQTLGVVTNNGGIATGAGKLTASSYGGGGTLTIVPQVTGPNLSVTGAATLTGGTLVVAGHPASGDYTVLTTGNALTTIFSAIDLPAGYTDLSNTYGAHDLIIDLGAPAPFTVTGQSRNQAAVGSALNAASLGATGDLLNVTNQLGTLTPTQLNAALDQIGPISLSALRGISFAGADMHGAALGQRMAGLQAGGSNPDGGRLASFDSSGKSAYPGTLVAEGIGDTSAAYAGNRDDGSPWGFFASALGTVGQLDAINGSSGAQPGYTFSSAGAAFGADYRVNDHFAAGLAGGYVGGSASVTDGSTVDSQSLRFGAYATAYDDRWHANLYLGGAEDMFDTSRSIAAFGRTATASPTGQEFNADALVGYDFKPDFATVSPFVGLSYDRLMVGSFTESGAGALDLSVSPETAESLRSRLGAKVSRKLKSGSIFLTPFASAAWEHEYDNQSRAIDAQFGTTPGSGFAVSTADAARDGALVGAGLDADWGKGFSTRLAYSGDFRSDFYASTLSGSLRLKF